MSLLIPMDGILSNKRNSDHIKIDSSHQTSSPSKLRNSTLRAMSQEEIQGYIVTRGNVQWYSRHLLGEKGFRSEQHTHCY